MYRETRSPKHGWAELTNKQPVLCQKCARFLPEVATVSAFSHGKLYPWKNFYHI